METLIRQATHNAFRLMEYTNNCQSFSVIVTGFRRVSSFPFHSFFLSFCCVHVLCVWIDTVIVESWKQITWQVYNASCSWYCLPVHCSSAYTSTFVFGTIIAQIDFCLVTREVLPRRLVYTVPFTLRALEKEYYHLASLYVVFSVFY
jgi:hypothetical protein